MRCLRRNKQLFYYSQYQGTEEMQDEHGIKTGEYKKVYVNPTPIEAHISPATGQSQTEQFGNLIQYDKVIVIDDVNCPIDENTVLYIDSPPECDDCGYPTPDYLVTKIARSLNSVAIAISKVTVS